MILRGLIILAIAGVLGVAALAAVVEPAPSVTSLERGLGAEVETTRL